MCLKHKCKVDIWRWNVVDDYRTLFTQSGRYQKWSERGRLRMLAKAVNKIKPEIYKEEEIKQIRKEEWEYQLKENILCLNYWKRRRVHNAPQLVLTESDDVDPEVQSQFEVNTESVNAAELLTESERQELENIVDTNIPEQEVQKEINVNAVSVLSENLPTTHKSPVKVTPQTAAVNIIEADFEEDYLTDRDSEDSLETVMLNENQIVNVHEKLQSDEVAPEIEKIYGINTLSMTIDSQMSTQSQDLRAIQSEDILPSSYDHFKNIIPLTSTQSQSQGAEEINVV